MPTEYTPGDLFSEMSRDGWLERTSGDAADHACQTIKTAMADGVRGAEMLYDTWAHEGARRDWNDFARGARQRFKAHDGRVLSARESYMRPVRTDDGRKTNAYQPRLIIAMTRPELREVLAQQRAQHERIGEAVLIMQGLLDTWDRFPEAETVRDLLNAAGIDLDSGLIEGVL